ncbi:MAG: AraC family transcriptional regulator [Rouxiella aceris]|uniref:AraC family transcriptional regulator n=1 Tax=Rouxiella aceris TaxID=2703884 RepID=UPI0028426572|nr:AraC family transcriptional regulator [Rouxiella aceris]MDR3433689.1 AraC family transcriptional regulator [Rouxiella aceris]
MPIFYELYTKLLEIITGVLRTINVYCVSTNEEGKKTTLDNHRPTRPLVGREIFSSSSVAHLAESVSHKIGGTLLEVGEDRPFTAFGDCLRLPNTELWFCSYDIPVKLTFGETPYFRVQFHYSGTGKTVLGVHEIEICPNQGCISAEPATINFDAHFQQIVWRIPKSLATQKIMDLTGLSVMEPLQFQPVLSFSRRGYDTLTCLLMCTILKIARLRVEPNPFVLAELEQAMLVALLCQSDHNYRTYLDQVFPVAIPWQIRRIEQHIEQNLRSPLDLDELAETIGCSRRTIFRVFQVFRGYSPGEFLKQRRLQRAKLMLGNTASNFSLEVIANDCGFNSASHLSREFSKQFGFPPSAARR